MTTSQDSKKTTGNEASNPQAPSVKSNAQKATQTSTPAKKAPQKQTSVKSGQPVKQSTSDLSNKKDNSSASQHIADQIKTFPRRRVWPD